MEQKSEIIIYQTANKETQIDVQFNEETVWLTQSQMVKLFSSSKANISEHLANIFSSEELYAEATVRKLRTVQKEGKRIVSRELDHYNLDVIISIGYRVNTKIGIQFRQWATQRLKDFLVKGYAINQKRLEENKAQFIKSLDDIKILSQYNNQVEVNNILSLIQSFSNTFFNLDSYDKNEFPKEGKQQEIETSAKELFVDLLQLKTELIRKNEATELFAQEKIKGNLEGIFGNVFQSVFGHDAYPTVEEKAAHLLYFIIKNHPFNDGNKRSGAFSFIWLLHKANYNFRNKISPETLTTLTILIANSDPSDKDKMIGIVKLLLNK
ncbi:MAG: virulence protein RhuM/Fic/DOC family protein [Bacteroidetes bacterium]|nr:virulence protein RhuM/Fic/DOC family protein [Bacteroidota bacterium]